MSEKYTANQSNVNTPKPNMNVGEAAIYTGISERLMWDLIAKREICSIRIGRRVIVRQRDIDDFLESKISK